MVNCQLKDKAYNGNCEGCTSRSYCMMVEIIERLRSVETELAQLKTAKAV
jgi:Fe-S cluster biogenesis protein NfuA